MGGTGLEPVSPTTVHSNDLRQPTPDSAAKCAALGVEEIIAAWPNLRLGIRVAISQMVHDALQQRDFWHARSADACRVVHTEAGE